MRCNARNAMRNAKRLDPISITPPYLPICTASSASCSIWNCPRLRHSNAIAMPRSSIVTGPCSAVVILARAAIANPTLAKAAAMSSMLAATDAARHPAAEDGPSSSSRLAPSRRAAAGSRSCHSCSRVVAIQKTPYAQWKRDSMAQSSAGPRRLCRRPVRSWAAPLHVVSSSRTLLHLR